MQDGVPGKWRVLAILFFAGAINYADRTAITSVFPLLRQDLALTDVGLAAIGSLFLWSYAFTSPFAGILADRVSRSRLIAISLALWSLVTAATGLVSNPEQLFALRLLLGISECLYLPAALGLVADYHGPLTRATALSVHASGLSFGMIAGGTVAGFLGDRLGWRPCFFILGGAGVALALAATLLVRDPANSPRASGGGEPLRETLTALLHAPAYGIILTEAALIAVSNWVFANWLPLFFRETYGLSLATAGFSGTFAVTAGVVTGGLTGGYFSDRIARGNPRKRLLLQGLFYAAAAPFLLVFLGKPAVAILGASIFMHGLVRALGSSNELPILCDLLPSHRRSTAIGFMNSLNTFIGGSGVFLSGYLKSHFGLGQVFLGLAGVVLLASIACLAGYHLLKSSLTRAQNAAS
ncbi:MAG: MFS transporter [Bryobacteraceae bacterium]